MGRKKIKKPTIQLVGNNATDVTGSIILVTTMSGKQVLFECGGIQGGTVEEDYRANMNSLNSVDAENVDYIFIAHNHYDHLGMLPRVIDLGFKGKIITTKQTARLMKPLLLDSCFIGKKNAEYMSQKYKRNLPPLYEEKDVYSTLSHTYEYGFDDIHKLDDEISFKLLRNSHVLGACSIELFIRDNESNKTYKISYTSDLGNVSIPNRPYLSEMEYTKTSNIHISESTYGNREECYTKKDRKQEIELIKEEITNCCIKNKGTLICPCFSFARSQEMITIMYQLFKNDKRFEDIDFIVDSKLTKEITKIYTEILEEEDKELFNEVLSWKNFKIISDFKTETTEVLKDRRPKVVISSSGFCEAGHVVEYIRQYLEDEKNTILFCGYASERSLAGRLRKDTKTIVIDKNKKPYKKKAKIITLKTFSSHMQRKELINYICSVNCDKVILVHGSQEAKESLKDGCREELSKRNKTTNVVCGQKNMKISL